MRYLILHNKSLLYAFRIVIACLVVWWSLDAVGAATKIFALISAIVVSEPDPDLLRQSAVSRIINTVIGGALGLLSMLLLDINLWSLIIAITISVLISTSFKNYPTSWKLAPATVAIIIVPAITGHEEYKLAMQVALERTAEVMYGCLVAFLLGLVLNFWRSKLISRYATPEETTGKSSFIKANSTN
jgi:uncharacterized membrane protein YccC